MKTSSLTSGLEARNRLIIFTELTWKIEAKMAEFLQNQQLMVRLHLLRVLALWEI
jgi:hypothetical protein